MPRTKSTGAAAMCEQASVVVAREACAAPVVDDKRWGRRTFRRIATAAGWATASPNKLRHLHASLLITEGRLDAREIAERMGHSVEMLERRYAHEIREYRGRRIDVAVEIEQARALARSNGLPHGSLGRAD